jgi:5-(carboxyamino)imidazole ribonucleotide mutase
VKPLVAIIMGSAADWPIMEHAAVELDALGVPHEVRVMSAHRTPDLVREYVSGAESRGVEVIIAAAGCAAHLAGAAAAHTVLPVLGVPLDTSALKGLDALLATVQMPAGIPVATFAIGRAGAINAAICAAMICASSRLELRDAIRARRAADAAKIAAHPDPRVG